MHQISDICKIRVYQGLSQEKLAELADVSVSQLRNIEKGNNKPRYSTLMKINEALGLNIPYFKIFEVPYSPNNLKSYRNTFKLTQKDIQAMTGINSCLISNYENQKLLPAPDHCLKLETIFKTSIDNLFPHLKQDLEVAI